MVPESTSHTIAPTILFVIGALDIGGAERHLVQVLPHLRRNGFRPLVYTLTHEGYLASLLRSRGVSVISPPLSDKIRKMPKAIRPCLSLPLTALTLWLTLQRRRPDIVHYFLPASYLLGGICSLFSRKRLEVMSRRSLNQYQKKYPRLARIEWFLHRRMNALIGNSKTVVAQLAAEGAPSERLGVIFNGVAGIDVGGRLPSTEIRQSLNLKPSVLVFVMVANIISYKGHEDVLRAVAYVQGCFLRDFVMLFVGRNDGLEDSLRDLAHSLGIGERVRWLGQRTDIPGILEVSDIGLLCSHEEGFSNTVLEGMAAGLPMIVTDVGGNKEAVLNGVTGIVVPNHSPESIGKAILKLAQSSELRQIMGEAGRERVRKNFSLETCIENYKRLYWGLLRKPNMPVQEMLQGLDPIL